MRRSTAAAALLTALVMGVLGPPAIATAQPPDNDVAACLDGSCTLRLTGPVEIPLDGRTGQTGISVSSIGPYAVEFRLHSANRSGMGVVGRGGTVRFGSEKGMLTVRVLELGTDAAVIELSTQPA